MKLASRIFKKDKYYITSKFGYRKAINTKAGVSSSFHNGCDYGTHCQKWAQYAIENGIVINCGKATDGALYVWVKYPRLNIKLLHYHLDSICVKNNQRVDNKTILGYTGMTGKATGIHLHLSMKFLDSDKYIDPELYDYQESLNNDAYIIGNYITLENMNIRKGAGINFAIKKVKDISLNKREYLINSNLNSNAIYKVNTKFTALKIIKKNSEVWALIPSGYICIKGVSGKKYCRKL